MKLTSFVLRIFYFISFIAVFSNMALAGLIDLSSWSEEGPGGGVWTVAGDNNSVIQSVNSTTPTFFISSNPFINSKFTGTIAVETTGDDDFIGFVFGYKSPFTGNSDGNYDLDFLLFDWKQANQNSAIAGFHLSRVQGNFSDNSTEHSVSNMTNPFWSHNDNIDGNSSFILLDSLTGSDQGWTVNTIYNFELSFQTNLIEIEIDGGAFEHQTIFSVSGDYDAGSFGFYNYSQNNVRYAGVAETYAPASIPEPTTLFLFLSGLIGLSLCRFKKALQ